MKQELAIEASRMWAQRTINSAAATIAGMTLVAHACATDAPTSCKPHQRWMRCVLLRDARRLVAMLPMSILLALAASPAQAGMVFGPYLIWMNFAGDTSADHALHDYTHTDTTADMCWTEKARLLTGGYLPEITPELVQRAVIKRQPAAQSRLRALLRKGDDARRDGYDGVIVVPKGAKPMLMSFGADGKLRSHKAVDKAGEPAWADAFCEVQPPILRKP